MHKRIMKGIEHKGMKGRIKDGNLELDKGLGLRRQFCPYCDDSCGIWCPSFAWTECENGSVVLQLCRECGYYFFEPGEFVIEPREEEEEDDTCLKREPEKWDDRPSKGGKNG